MRKGTHHSENTRQKLSNLTKTAHIEGRIQPYFKGKEIPLEVREIISKSRQGQAPWNKGLSGWMATEQKLRLARWGISPSNKGKPFRHKGSFQKGHLDISRNKGRKRTEEQKNRTREIMKALWSDVEYAKRQMAAIHRKPNKKELFLGTILEKHFPKQWKYVGSGELIIGGKCPDFANIDGKKQLIELFGDYWHGGETPQDKTDHYKSYGYMTLVIWEHELSNSEAVINRVKEQGLE